jgi:hypothetical protein
LPRPIGGAFPAIFHDHGRDSIRPTFAARITSQRGTAPRPSAPRQHSSRIIEELLVLARGFDRGMIAGMVDNGLAMAEREILAASDGALVELIRIRISDAGRQALEG